MDKKWKAVFGLMGVVLILLLILSGSNASKIGKLETWARDEVKFMSDTRDALNDLEDRIWFNALTEEEKDLRRVEITDATLKVYPNDIRVPTISVKRGMYYFDTSSLIWYWDPISEDFYEKDLPPPFWRRTWEFRPGPVWKGGGR